LAVLYCVKTLCVVLVGLLLGGIGIETARAEQANDRSGRRPGGNALLVIHRAANFGTKQGCIISIDGVSYGILGYNRHLRTLVAPGAHVVTMRPVPNFHRAVLQNRQRIYVHGGRANVFTLTWESGDVPVLK
jgi:hypothetical protein